MSSSLIALAFACLGAAPVAALESDPAPAPVVASDGIPVLRSGIALELEVVGGERYQGAFVGLEDPMLLLSTSEGVEELPMPVVLEVSVEGQPYSPEAFLEGVQRWGQVLVDEAVRVPPPLLVGGLSVLWAGAGPAALGDRKAAFAYSILELSFIGAGAVMISNDQYGPLLPLAALDGLLHFWAVSESVRESKRRRSRAKLALTPTVGASGAGGDALGIGLWLHAGAPASSGPSVVGPCVEPGLTGPCTLP